MKNNKQKGISILMAGCLITSTVTPALAVNDLVDSESSSQEQTLSISLNDGIVRESVSQVKLSSIGGMPFEEGLEALWNASTQKFEITGYSADNPLVVGRLTWQDEFCPDIVTGTESKENEITFKIDRGKFSIISDFISVDKKTSTVEVEENKVSVTINGHYLPCTGETKSFLMMVPQGAEMNKGIDFNEQITFGKSYSCEAPVDNICYDVYLQIKNETSGIIRYWKIGTATVGSTENLEPEPPYQQESDDSIAEKIILNGLCGNFVSENQMKVASIETQVDVTTIDGFSSDKLALSVSETSISKITGSVIEPKGRSLQFKIPESQYSETNLYLFYGNALVGKIKEAGSPDVSTTENQFSVVQGSSLLFSFPYNPGTYVSMDSLRVTSSSVLSEAPRKEDFALFIDAKEHTPVSDVEINNVSLLNGTTLDIRISGTYESLKDKTKLSLFYQGKYVGDIPVSVVTASKPVINLGSDAEIRLEFPKNALNTESSTDTINISSNMTVHGEKFVLKDSSGQVVDVSFMTTNDHETLIARGKKSLQSGTYKLFYEEEEVGDITVVITEREGETDQVFVPFPSLLFEYPHNAAAGDKQINQLVIQSSSPNTELTESDFSIQADGKPSNIFHIEGLQRKADGIYELGISMNYQADYLGGVIDLMYKNQKVADISISVLTMPNNDFAIASQIHDVLAQMQGENSASGTPPTASLPYDEAYVGNKEKQAEKLQAMMQNWIDDCSVLEGYESWRSAKIHFSYDESTDQFKSIVSLGDKQTGAKIWNVVIKPKPVPDIHPSVDARSVNIMKGSSQKISVSLGSGVSAATSATITIQNPEVVDVNTQIITSVNLSDGIVIKGLSVGNTVLQVAFNDKQNTVIDVPVEVNAKTYTVTSSVNNEAYGSVSSSISHYDGTVEENGEVTFTFNPQKGYKVQEVLVDGFPVEIANNKYTFERVKGNHTLFVQFKPLESNLDLLPTVNMDSIRMKVGDDNKLKITFGSGSHEASSATVIARNNTIISLSTNKVTTKTLKDGIIVTAMKKGSTTIEIVFDDKNKTKIEIPVKISESSDDSDENNNSADKKPKLDFNKGGQVTAMPDNKTIVIKPDAGYRIKEVFVNGRSVGIVDYYEFDKTSTKNRVKVIFEKIENSIIPPVTPSVTPPVTFLPSVQQNPNSFTDISGHWAENYIQFFKDQGWISGVSQNIFAPDMNMTRGMFVTVLGRMTGIEGVSGTKFKDVPNDSYYAKYIYWAYKNGIVKGSDVNHFEPESNITRQEMAVIVCRWLEKMNVQMNKTTKKLFADDSKIETWAKSSVYALANLDIVQGSEKNLYNPTQPATRAELVAVLYRASNKK